MNHHLRDNGFTPAPAAPRGLRVRRRYVATVWRTLLVLAIMISACLAFHRPIVGVVKGHRAFRYTNRHDGGIVVVPCTNDYKDLRFPTVKRTKSLVAMFERKQNNDAEYTIFGKADQASAMVERKQNNDVEYTIFGKVDQASKTDNDQRRERMSRRKVGRKRRVMKRAFQKMYQTIKGGSYDLIFNEIDSDGDGVISREEIETYSSTIEFLKELKDMVDGDGLIRRDEFDRAATSQKFFDSLDADGDGKLDQAELVNLIKYDLSLLDEDGDGSIDRHEFQRAARINTNVEDTIEDTLGELEPLERAGFRLNGFDPYILVSVLTAGASFDVIKGHGVKWEDIASKSSIAALTPEDWVVSILLLTASVSTLVGIYAAVVFSLTVLYGRTALGLEKDDEYYSFLDTTGLQRYRAFKAFTLSLALFCGVVVIEMFRKTASVFWIPIAMASAFFLYAGSTEYSSIMSAAAPIFIKQDLNPVNEETDDA